jgi:hypothetical protein
MNKKTKTKTVIVIVTLQRQSYYKESSQHIERSKTVIGQVFHWSIKDKDWKTDKDKDKDKDWRLKTRQLLTEDKDRQLLKTKTVI